MDVVFYTAGIIVLVILAVVTVGALTSLPVITVLDLSLFPVFGLPPSV